MVNILIKAKELILKCAKSKRLSNLTLIFSGILGTLPYFAEELFLFTFVSLLALFYIVITQRRVCKRTFAPFFMYFLGFYTPLYFFLSELYPYDRFGFSGSQAGLIAVCSCILIPLLHAAVTSLVMLISKWIKDDWKLIFGYAGMWVIHEWVLSLGNMAFPWSNIAVSLTGVIPCLQTASLFGKDFISFITIAACVAFIFAVKEKKRAFAVTGALIIAVNFILGTALMYIDKSTAETVPAAVVQGNVLSNEKWIQGNSERILDTYVSMSKEAADNGAKIIILPESAIPFTFTENGIIHKELAKICKERNVTIITGINYREQGVLYNSVIGIYPNGELSVRYDKRHLVPFGEFIPLVNLLGKIIPFVAEFSADSGNYSQGTEAVVIDTEYGKIVPLVCFDSIFSKYAREGAANDGELIAVVTNDSWFNDSQGIYTHLRHGQIRAIETGKYIARAANTGISAFIDDKGRIIEKSGALTKDIVYCDLSMIKDKTLYTYLGDVILYASFGITIVLIILNFRGIKNGKNPTA